MEMELTMNRELLNYYHYIIIILLCNIILLYYMVDSYVM